MEHITSEKNVINLECKFAFINLMVAIHTTIKKINKHEKNRAEIRAADFSLEFRLKTSLQKMCLSAKLLASHEDVLRGSSRVPTATFVGQELACVASVSNRVTARKLEREQKKKKGGRFLHSPPPPPSFLVFCSRPNFLEELARKRLLRRLCRNA